MPEDQANINKGVNLPALQAFKEKVKRDPSRARRSPAALAEWVGGDESRVTFGEHVFTIGGPNHPNPMQMLLCSFAACDVDMLAMHASFIGVKLESLSVEARGNFDVQAYLGVADQPGSGYDQIEYTIKVDAPGITQEQIDYLIERCQKSSPVGDTLARPVQMKLDFVVSGG